MCDWTCVSPRSNSATHRHGASRNTLATRQIWSCQGLSIASRVTMTPSGTRTTRGITAASTSPVIAMSLRTMILFPLKNTLDWQRRPCPIEPQTANQPRVNVSRLQDNDLMTAKTTSRLLVCNCQRTMNIDAAALGKALGLEKSPVLYTELCRAQLYRIRRGYPNRLCPFTSPAPRKRRCFARSPMREARAMPH